VKYKSAVGTESKAVGIAAPARRIRLRALSASKRPIFPAPFSANQIFAFGVGSRPSGLASGWAPKDFHSPVCGSRRAKLIGVLQGYPDNAVRIHSGIVRPGIFDMGTPLPESRP